MANDFPDKNGIPLREGFYRDIRKGDLCHCPMNFENTPYATLERLTGRFDVA